MKTNLTNQKRSGGIPPGLTFQKGWGRMKNWRDESGVIMVEAALYFPIVIFTMFAMIYFGMMKYQESILTFQVEKLAQMGGKEIAYPGYSAFTDDGSVESSAVDFKKDKDFSGEVAGYYERFNGHLYNEWEIGKNAYIDKRAELEERLSRMLSRSSFLTGVDSTAKVEVESYVIGRSIKVTATYGIKSPKFLEYVGVPMDLTLKTVVKRSASSPVELVRNVNLAIDLTNFLLKKLGIDGKVDQFLKKAEDIKNKIL